MFSLTTITISVLLIASRPELFDEYTRRQYVAKAPLRNPFGEDEEPAKFSEFDIFTKVWVTSFNARLN